MLVSRMQCTAVAIGVAGACLLSACGSSGSSKSGNGEAQKTGPQVAKDAADALAASGAVHLSGQVTDSSTKKQIGVDLTLQSDGTTGTFTLDGQPVNVISTGGTSYLKAPAAFYQAEQASPAAAAKLANRWVKAQDSGQFDNFSLTSLSKEFAQPTDSKIDNKVSTGSLNGQSVVIVTQQDGSKLYVAATGKPLPLKAENSAQSKSGGGTLTFSDYGKRQQIQPPAGAVDASSLGA